LANKFLKWFEPIDSPKRVIIAPEGMHRFYWKGFSGKVVASWMTKEDRLSDIEDYTNYLQNLYQSTKQDNPTAKIHVLGFSQGVATMFRWLEKRKVEVDQFTCWAGSVPDDLDLKKINTNTGISSINYVAGNQDEFLTEQAISTNIKLLQDSGYKVISHSFDGPHRILPEPLNGLIDQTSR